MVLIAIEKGIFRDSEAMNIVREFFSKRSTSLQSYKLPNDAVVKVDGYEYACATYMIPDIKIMQDLIKELKANNPYAKPVIFISTLGEWRSMTQEDKKNEPSVVQNITAQTVGQIAAHDITISNQFLAPQNYLSVLEQAIKDDPKFSVASKPEKESLLSKIKALKNDPWVATIGTTALIEVGKKMLVQ